MDLHFTKVINFFDNQPSLIEKCSITFKLNIFKRRISRKGAPSIAPSPSLLSNINSKTSHIPILILQLIIQILGGMIIGIGICKPLRKVTVVIHLGFLLAKRIGLVVTNNPIAILATTFTFQNLKFFS